MRGDERIRLFVALELPEDASEALHAFGVALGAGRVVPARDLHVTLAFLGSVPAAVVGDVARVVQRAVSATPAPMLGVAGWRATRSVGMVVLQDDDGVAAALAAAVQAGLEALGIYRPERRPWLPHVTVARFRERPAIRVGPLPIRTFVPSGAAAYLSRPHPSGARYEALARFGWDAEQPDEDQGVRA